MGKRASLSATGRLATGAGSNTKLLMENFLWPARLDVRGSAAVSWLAIAVCQPTGVHGRPREPAHSCIGRPFDPETTGSKRLKVGQNRVRAGLKNSISG